MSLHRLNFRAMGCDMLATVETELETPPPALSNVPKWFEHWEQTLSRFRLDSELSHLNARFDQPVQVSQTLWEVFQASLTAEEATGGLVTPTVLEAVIEAGYNRSFDELPQNQDQPELSLLASVSPVSRITWDEFTRTIWLPYGVRLDFGGIAKGWSAHQAAEQLSEFGPALVDSAGDIAISAPRLANEPWKVSVANPFDPADEVEMLRLGRCGVATSGKDRRHWTQNGFSRHHIIDPRTGTSAETDVVTATIIAPTVMEAEAAAKAVMILGSKAGLEFIESDPTLAGLMILDSGRMLYSQRMNEYFWS